jgi:ribosomal-protein-alanine N-acetyltransferase
MHIRFELLSEEQARTLAGWRYPPPYDFHNLDAYLADPWELLDRRSPYYAAVDPLGELVGFFCFRHTAQVPAGFVAGAYDDHTSLDIGLGLRPDLTGRGLGLGFVEAGLRFAREVFSPPSFRLSVATFNRRAIAIYERAGFTPIRTFISRANGSEHEFIVMVRPAVLESQDTGCVSG